MARAFRAECRATRRNRADALLRSCLLCRCGGPVRCLASFRLVPLLVNGASRRRASPAAAPSRTLRSTNRAGVCLACYALTAPACRGLCVGLLAAIVVSGRGLRAFGFRFSKPRARNCHIREYLLSVRRLPRQVSASVARILPRCFFSPASLVRPKATFGEKVGAESSESQLSLTRGARNHLNSKCASLCLCGTSN